MHRLSLVFLALVPAVAVPAQQSAGPLAGSALALAVDGGAAGAPDATTLVHRNGFGSPLAQFPVSSSRPNLQAILALHGAANLDVDDLSTGRDDIMVDATGTTFITANRWGLFSFSFANGAQGQPGSRLAAEPASDRGSALFTWILPGSFVPTALIDVVERSHSRAELGAPPGGDVDSLDHPLVMGLDQGTLASTEPGFHTLLPSQPEIYFTVSNSSLGQVPSSWWNMPGVPPMPSGATILVTRLSPTAGIWTPPTTYKMFFELGLQQTEDIDALALDASSDRIIFSCVGGARDQLLYVDTSDDNPTPPVPVKKPGGTPVSDAVGSAGGDDIDAVCTLDPRLRSGNYLPDDFGASCGSPRPAYLPNLYPIGPAASAYRRYENGAIHYDTWVVGWPQSTGPGPGWAILAITLDNTLAPVFTAAFLPRNPANPVAGDPQHFSQSIPPGLALTGLPLTFRWFVADAAGTEISQAYPVKVFL